MLNHVILVDENDVQIGTEEKLVAHQLGLLHRAFSILLFNDTGEMLIHQRASDKYHSSGLWTNTCCSHQRPNEITIEAAERRLFEEMGIKTDLQFVNKFMYTTEFENGLIENEMDHILIGNFSGDVIPNPDEVQDWKYISEIELLNDVSKYPENYSSWFKIILETQLDTIKSFKKC
jgi:isopentenyl-diphosphate Delta-isomerase